MINTTHPFLSTTAIAGLILLAGCSSEPSSVPGDGQPVQSDTTSNVPAGVAAQYANMAGEIAEAGGETTAGPWRVGYIVEVAEPWYEHDGEGYHFREPADGETHHIEILPFEVETGRLVPDVPITVEIIAADGSVVDSKELNFYYHETFFHYANNFSLPGPGVYTLRATLGRPAFHRHGAGDHPPALAEGVTVDFEDVELGR